jgi:hypothetical protein
MNFLTVLLCIALIGLAVSPAIYLIYKIAQDNSGGTPSDLEMLRHLAELEYIGKRTDGKK